MNELALFAGGGGSVLAGALLGWRTVCAVEIDASARRILLARQRDGIIPAFPIWDDICTFDGRPWRGYVDVVTGGFPCQDISIAGSGQGLDGARSGLWFEMARIICEVRPRLVLVENSPVLTSRGLGRVLGDLAAVGFDAEWGVLGADDVGAPHIRKRIWILAADPANSQQLQPQGREQEQRRRLDDRAAEVADLDGAGREEQRRPKSGIARHAAAERADWWAAEPGVGRMVHGMAHRVDRIRALGNGWVPAVAAAAVRRLSGVTHP